MFYIRMSTEKEAEEYFGKTGHWGVANLRQAIGWPEHKIIIWFRKIPLLLLPETADQYPAVAVLYKGISEKDAQESVVQFLSSLCWAQGGPIAIESWTGGSRPFRMGKSQGVRFINKSFRIDYLPDPLDQTTRMALAFYREARTLNHPAYAFLNYFRVINLKYTTGPKQKAWISKNLPLLKDHEAQKRLAEIQKTGEDVAKYLYHSCRCAIAHASIQEVTINPESFTDIRRLSTDLPLIKNLAETLIENELGVKRPTTVHKEHLYQLAGFKEVLGKQPVEDLKIKGEIPTNFPIELSVRLWGRERQDVFERMNVVELSAVPGKLQVLCAPIDYDGMRLLIVLNFNEEKMLFHPQQSISIDDDQSVVAAQVNLQAAKFLREYWINGIIEIWDRQKDQCLGYADAFVPVNIDLARTLENFDKNIITLTQTLKVREVITLANTAGDGN